MTAKFIGKYSWNHQCIGATAEGGWVSLPLKIKVCPDCGVRIPDNDAD